MSIPLCTACPTADRCCFRLSRPMDRQNTPEFELSMLELRKRDEDQLCDMARTQTFMVRQGAFKTMTPGKDIVQLVGAGDLFGPEIHFLPKPVSLTAKSLMPELTVCTVSNVIFEKWVFERKSLSTSVLNLLAARSMEARLSYHWAKKTLRERAVLTLCSLRDRFGVRYGQFQMIDIPLTKIDLASLMSTVQESAVRVLSEFREDGLISANGKRIVIMDNDRLEQMRDEIIQKSHSDEDEDASEILT